MVSSRMKWVGFLLSIAGTGACGGGGDTPPAGGGVVVTLVESSGPDAELRYRIVHRVTDAAGAEVGTSQLSFVFLAGATPFDAGPLAIDATGEPLTAPRVDATVTAIDAVLSVDMGEVRYATTLRASAVGGGPLVGASDLATSGELQLGYFGAAADAEFFDLVLDVAPDGDATACDGEFPCGGSLVIDFIPGAEPDMQYEDRLMAVSFMGVDFDGSARAHVFFELEETALLRKLGGGQLGKILSVAQGQLGGLFENDTVASGAAASARRTITSWWLGLFAKDVAGNSYKALKAVYGVGTAEAVGTAALKKLFDTLEKGAKDAAKDALEREDLETLTRDYGDGKRVTVACDRAQGTGSLLISGQTVVKEANGQCKSADYAITCRFTVDADCNIITTGPFVCDPPVSSNVQIVDPCPTCGVDATGGGLKPGPRSAAATEGGVCHPRVCTIDDVVDLN